MSDEFNVPGRSFKPGEDHLWTSIEKPDGVNGALEYYSHNMTSTACDDAGNCYYYIKVMDEVTSLSVYNQYLSTPGYETVSFYYRSAMVQSWNKFCFQGGMIEVRAQLPGAVSNSSGNPDLSLGASGKTANIDYYPTWPGIWMMGNLGRAIFSASTNRMWPYSYDACEPSIFNAAKNQRINACESNPGYGLNPNQGRGAPEIDILEGGGTAISSSVQVGPGMPKDFRMIVPENPDYGGCFYSGDCKTPGANLPGVPTAVYAKRGHKSWYQGLRYQSNLFCKPDGSMRQDYTTVANAVKTGIITNTCTLATCPGSFDVGADLGLVNGTGSTHWGINYDGTCFPKMNVYTGAFLCDPDNQNPSCEKPRPDNQTATHVMTPFDYQMDAISSNWPVHVGAYTDFLIYQLEWVTGKNGYVRWMLDGNAIFEITAESIENVPQDAGQTNPTKKMLDEPMYLIFNVALSATWGSKPIFTDKPCRGDGTNAKATKICDEYPMFLKIDYIRLYQDLGSDLDADNLMAIGCDPKSHPTKQWIDGHIDEYTDPNNMWKPVVGGAPCTTDADCTIGSTGDIAYVSLVTGKCSNKRCECFYTDSWGGPRCTSALSTSQREGDNFQGFGPPMGAAVGLAAVVVVATVMSMKMNRASSAVYFDPRHEVNGRKGALPSDLCGDAVSLDMSGRGVPQHTDYNKNFV
jgi:beta-glucan synthesis-associated protein KRE6